MNERMNPRLIKLIKMIIGPEYEAYDEITKTTIYFKSEKLFGEIMNDHKLEDPGRRDELPFYDTEVETKVNSDSIDEAKAQAIMHDFITTMYKFVKSEIVVLWMNFGSAISKNQTDLYLSLDTVKLVNRQIGGSRDRCNCGEITTRTINVKDRRDTYLKIVNVRGKLHEHAVAIAYGLLKKTIEEEYGQVLDLGYKNMAVSVPKFNDLTIVKRFLVKLGKYFTFTIEINKMGVINQEYKNEIPFMCIDDEAIAEFQKWINSVHPFLP